MSEHIFDPSGPYHPEKLSKKAHIGADSFFQLDLRTGVIIRSEEFPEMRKPSYKIEVKLLHFLSNISRVLSNRHVIEFRKHLRKISSGPSHTVIIFS